MLQNLPDIIVGAVFFSALVVLSVAGGGLIQRTRQSRNRKALAPLAPMISGRLSSDHKSAWMVGEYRGQTFHVRSTPGQDISQSSEYSIRVNDFEISLRDVPGGQDWEIAYTGLLRKNWSIKTSDANLKIGLERFGLVARLQSTGGYPALRYRAADQSLHLVEDVKPRLAPSPEQFRQRLDLLIYTAEVSASLSPEIP